MHIIYGSECLFLVRNEDETKTLRATFSNSELRMLYVINTIRMVFFVLAPHYIYLLVIIIIVPDIHLQISIKNSIALRKTSVLTRVDVECVQQHNVHTTQKSL